MQEEIGLFEQRSKKMGMMDKRQADLTKDVKLLQETFTDYNMVLEKVSQERS